MQNENSKMQRIPEFDIAKGLAMLLVIVGHSCTFGHQIIYSFHMPLFFILAGYFYHPKPIMESLKNDFSRLVIPYIFSITLYLCYYAVISIYTHDVHALLVRMAAAFFGTGSEHTSKFLSGVPRLGPIWFLLALFWCKVSYNIIYSLLKHPLIVTVLVVGGVSITSTLLDAYVINLPFDLLPGMSSMIFYMIGHLSNVYKAKIMRIKTLLLLSSGICFFIAINYSHLNMAICSYGMPLIDIPAACFGSYIIFIFSKFLDHTVLRKIFSWLGENSMAILCFHFLEISTGLLSHLNASISFIIIIRILLVVFCTMLSFYFSAFRKVYHITKWN